MNSPLLVAGLVFLSVATMTTVGTGLRLDDFGALIRKPLVLAKALVANVVVVPAAAVALVAVTGLDGPAAYGIVLAAAAPGGGTGVLLAFHARGDLVLAVSLQGALLPIGLASVPVWASVRDADVGAAPWPQLVGLLVLQLVPLAAGMGIRARAPDRAARVQRRSRRVADALLITTTAYVLASTAGDLVDIPLAAYAVMVTVVLVSLASYGTPGFPSRGARGAVAMTTAVRNLSLAFLVAGLAEEGDVVMLTLIAYGIVMYGLGAVAILAIRRSSTSAAETVLVPALCDRTSSIDPAFD